MNQTIGPEQEVLFATGRMRPNIRENIEAEKMKLSLTDRFPARIELALVHQAANKFGVTRNDQDQTCACCDERIGILKLPQRVTLQTINCPTGIILSFSFIRMTMFYMMLHFSITGLYNMYSNMKGRQCGDSYYPDLKDCRQSNIFLKISPVNKYHDPQEFYYCSIFNFLFILASIVFFIVYRKIHYQSHIIASQKNQTMDQYAVFLSNIPKMSNNGNVVTQKQIQQVCYEILQKWRQKMQKLEEKSQRYLHYLECQRLQSNHPPERVQKPKGDDIVTIHLCWDLSEIYQVIHNKQKLQDDVQKMAISIIQGANHRPSYQSGMYKYKLRYPPIKQQIDNVNNELLQLARQYSMKEVRTPQFYITHFIGKAFVVFQYQHFAQVVRQQIAKGNTYIGNNLLKSQWSSHPRDIYWQNLTISQQTRTRRQFVTITILLGTVFFSFCACILIQYLGIIFKPNEKIVIFGFGMYEVIITQLTNLVIYLVNLVLFKVMQGLTQYQKHQTRAYEQNSLLWKSLIAQFINSGITLILLHKVMKLHLWSDQGLTLTGGSQVLTGLVYDILIKLCSYSYFSKRFKLWYKYRNGPLEQPKFQSRLNAEFEWPQFDLADIYTGYACQIYIALFFSFFCPICTFLTALGFSIQYVLDKRILTSHSSVKNDYNFLISRQALKLLEKSIVVFAAGNLFFEYMFFTVSKFSIVGLIVTLIFTIVSRYVPFESQRKFLSQMVNYQNVCFISADKMGMFEHTYKNKDPSTRFTSKKFLGNTKNYCTLEDAQEWLSVYKKDEATPFPLYNPNCSAKSQLP